MLMENIYQSNNSSSTSPASLSQWALYLDSAQSAAADRGPSIPLIPPISSPVQAPRGRLWPARPPGLWPARRRLRKECTCHELKLMGNIDNLKATVTTVTVAGGASEHLASSPGRNA